MRPINTTSSSTELSIPEDTMEPTGAPLLPVDLELARLRQENLDCKATCKELQTRLQHQTEEQVLERIVIARELHDQTAQFLTALIMGLKSLEAFCPPHSPSRDTLDWVQDVTQSLAPAIYEVVTLLRPPSVGEIGLCPAVIKYLEDWSKRYHIRSNFESTGLLALYVPLEVEVTIYRMVQEALTNIIRHAQATTVNVSLCENDHHVVVIIADNGQGFDVEEVSRSGHRVGLKGMEERLSLVGSQLTIEPTLGEGTKLIAHIPLAAKRPM